MPFVTIATGALLCAIGLFGYFGSHSENPSVTALIPAFFGAAFIVLGAVALSPGARKHAMHAAAGLGLLGFILAGGRGIMKLGNAASDDIQIGRPARMVLLMAIVCLIFEIACIRSFIAARRRRTQSVDAT